ncbi:hypothetical protein BaRGS_00027180 [Batillaria attramentaria]|uniref:Uncharacterized protein n=1 Tax=Batillaria attramentaria TaxID=370345 RepID=A0ABD0K3W2_9CAEN
MATPVTTQDKVKSLSCALCLEVFRNPKLLPCSHTFCEICLEGLSTSVFAARLQCPTCRKQIDVPPGGVSAFQTNFYIDPEDLEKARNNAFCTVHPNRDLELFCEECNVPVCLKCKLSDHVTHETKDIKEAAVSGTREQQAVEDKKTLLEKAIRQREDTLKVAIASFRDEALASLNKIADDISGSLTTDWVTTITRPVLRFNATPEPTLKIMRDYMGSAAKMEMAVSAPEVTVIEQFRCREDPDTDVYHVCPTTDGKVWVSYEPNMIREGATSEMFTTDGEYVKTEKFDNRARITWAPRKDGLSMYYSLEIKTYISFAKRIEPRLTRFFQLENNLTGQATVHSVTIVVEDPLETEALEASIVTCAAHRAFDVDASEQLFVVLEEVQAPDLQRTVRLYRRPQPDAIATYSPPVAPFQPSDVCFYTLGGHEVLLVADELNDAIHVVNVQDGRLNFARYLAPGCPLLVQPTALNTDTRGRLWVACRGGRIITCTPISSANQ